MKNFRLQISDFRLGKVALCALLFCSTAFAQTDTLSINRSTHAIVGPTSAAQFRAANGLAPSIAARTIYVGKQTQATDTRTGLIATDPGAPFATVSAALTAAAALTPTVTAPVTVIVQPGTYAESAITLATGHLQLVMQPGAIISFASGGITRSTKNIHLIGGSLLGTGSNAGPLLNDTEFTGNAGQIINYTNFNSYTGAFVGDYDQHLLQDLVVENPTGIALGNVYGKLRNVQATGTIGLKDGWGTDMDSGCVFTGSVYGARIRTLVFTPSGNIGGDGRVLDYYTSNVTTAKTGGAKFICAMGFPDAVAFYGFAESNQTGFAADSTFGDPDVNEFVVWPPEVNGSYIKAPEGHNVDNADGHYLGGGIWGCGDFTACKVMGINPILHTTGHVYFSGGNITNNFIDGSFIVKYMANTAITDSILNFNSTGNDRVGTVAEFSRFIRITNEGDLVAGARGAQRFFEQSSDIANGAFGWERRDLAIYLDRNHTGQFMETAQTTDYATPAGTVEFWFKIAGSTRGDTGFCSHDNGSNTGWLINCVPNGGGSGSNLGQIYSYVGGSFIIVNNVAAFANTPAWHHLALTWSGTTQTLWLDGVSIGTGTAGTPAVNSNRMLIGASGNHLLGTSASVAGRGMMKQFRFSNSVLYTGTFTPPRFVDATTGLSIFNQTTTGPVTWEDKRHLHDAITKGGLVETSGIAITWVSENYTPAP